VVRVKTSLTCEWYYGVTPWDNSLSDPSGVFGLKNPLCPLQSAGAQPGGVGMKVWSAIDPKSTISGRL